MRKRYLKPEFFTDGKLLLCTPLARILFQGLWCASDREGRLIYKPEDLKIKILPADNCNIEDLTAELVKQGLVTVYNGFLQVNNFSKHQKPHPHEAKSVIPPMSLDVITCHDNVTKCNPLTLTRTIKRIDHSTVENGDNPEKILKSIGKFNKKLTSEENIMIMTWFDYDFDKVIKEIERVNSVYEPKNNKKPPVKYYHKCIQKLPLENKA